MAIPRFTSTSGTRIWEHLNAIATAVENMFTAARPFTRSAVYAKDVTWSGGAMIAVDVVWPTLPNVPAVVPFLTSAPGGSHGLVPRIANVTKSGATIRLYNASPYEMKLGSDLGVSVLVTPL